MWVYAFLDLFFIVFHTAFTLFNALGWIWRRTRRAHLVAVWLTAGSWVGLGFWKGFGYCFCTAWHWQVRHRLGKGADLPNSYVKFLVDTLLGTDVPARTVDTITGVVFALAFVLSCVLNARDWRRGASTPPA